ncbi:MAG: FHA domain-containing protein [Pseudomonadota bacterium]|nr:FHA domain-containing protein [Pseudomonadota bacterium]
MKLIFPGGEHPQVLLGLGVNRVGSDPQATIVLDSPGVLPQHCQLHVSATGVMLDVAAGTSVSVNGRPVQGLISLRSGDRVAFDKVQAHLASLEEGALRKHAGANADVLGAANDDPGATVIRPVLPKYLLRGMTGSVVGRNYPLAGPMTVGRARESDLLLDEQGLSRHHARLVPTATGIQVEDLGSSNGSFINGQRVVRGEACAGDEIAFDTLRFRLVSSEPMEVRAVQSKSSTRSRRRMWPWLLLAIAGVVIVLVASGVGAQPG